VWISGTLFAISFIWLLTITEKAIALVVDTLSVEKLTIAVNTRDEARTFGAVFGSEGTVVVVTDAIHMPQAIKLLKETGFNPVVAPTNHFKKYGSAANSLGWLP
jgi:uncharacterized SAM-binding protein YcdF (DUF218 family)